MNRVTIFALAIFVSSPSAAAPLRDTALRSTSKPVEQFVSCFVAVQERASLPWWFVPKDHGGTLSNLGANGARSGYFVGVSDLGSVRQVRLELASNQGRADRMVTKAVDQCI